MMQASNYNFMDFSNFSEQIGQENGMVRPDRARSDRGVGVPSARMSASAPASVPVGACRDRIEDAPSAKRRRFPHEPRRPHRFASTFRTRSLADLRERLGRTRWPDQIEAYGWRQGAELGRGSALRGLLGGWLRLAGGGGRAQPAAPVHRPRARAAPPLRAPALAPRGRHSAVHPARLAGVLSSSSTRLSRC